jgi:hypothetical protein
VAGTSHPPLELRQHKLIGTIDQGEIADCAVSISTVMESDVITRSTETANFRIAPDDDIKCRSNSRNLTPEI